jgi:hypothetical protein
MYWILLNNFFDSKFGVSLQFFKFKICDRMGLNKDCTFYFIVTFDANKINFVEWVMFHFNINIQSHKLRIKLYFDI